MVGTGTEQVRECHERKADLREVSTERDHLLTAYHYARELQLTRERISTARQSWSTGAPLASGNDRDTLRRRRSDASTVMT